MQFLPLGRWFAILPLLLFCLTWTPSPHAWAQGAGGSGGGGSAGASSSGGGSGSGGGGGLQGGPNLGKSGKPQGKAPDAGSVTPQLPDAQSRQRDRERRLEQQLRQGQVDPSTPQTEMSDRLDQLYKNSPPTQKAPPTDRSR